MGNREILSFGDRRFILVDGVVTRIEENYPQSTTNATPASGSSPRPAPPTIEDRPAPLITGWLSDYELAKKQADLHDRPILVLFTGSDWCPPCIAFERGIASDPRFREFAAANLILFKADFPRSFALSPAVKAQNEALAREFGVRGFPTILAVNSEGKHLGTLDRSEANRGHDPVAGHIAGIEGIVGSGVTGLTPEKIAIGAIILGLVWFIYRRVA